MFDHLLPPPSITEAEALYIVESREMPAHYDHKRIIKAIDIVISGGVEPDAIIAGWTTYRVTNWAGMPYWNREYRITGCRCSCPDMSGYTCKHLIAVEIWQGCIAIQQADRAGSGTTRGIRILEWTQICTPWFVVPLYFWLFLFYGV